VGESTTEWSFGSSAGPPHPPPNGESITAVVVHCGGSSGHGRRASYFGAQKTAAALIAGEQT
jgi:hypothetical protein